MFKTVAILDLDIQEVGQVREIELWGVTKNILIRFLSILNYVLALKYASGVQDTENSLPNGNSTDDETGKYISLSIMGGQCLLILYYDFIQMKDIKTFFMESPERSSNFEKRLVKFYHALIYHHN